MAGSLVHDLVATVPHLPRPGEAVVASELRHSAGGKGFNQAVAARRLGAEVRMAGTVGRDAFGDEFCRLLDELEIDRAHVGRADAPTGIAVPMVEPGGENAIVVALGANLEPAPIPVSFLEGVDLLMLQGELAVATNLAAIELARGQGVPVLLNAAPADRRLEGALRSVACVVVNAGEEAHFGGPDRLRSLARPAAVVTTLGELGARLGDRRFEAPAVIAVDTTGAGDAFCAGLGMRLAEGAPLPEAIRFAVAAGAAACTRRGTSGSMPSREEVEALAG